MTSPIGNNNNGFTFIEVMVTLVILSAGIVAIYKTFFLCADYLSRLSTRAIASQVIDNKIKDIKQYVSTNDSLTFDRQGIIPVVESGSRNINFNYKAELLPVIGFDNLYQLQLNVSWMHQGHRMQLERLAILEAT